MKTGKKVLLGAVIIVPISYFAFVKKPIIDDQDVAGQLSPIWMYWHEGANGWQMMLAGVSLPINEELYFNIGGINMTEIPMKIHIDLFLIGGEIEDTKLLAYVGQDKKFATNEGGAVGFGPVVIPVAGDYTLEATLKINGNVADTDSMEFSAA